MKKSEAIKLLRDGRDINWETIFPQVSTMNGFVYKNSAAFLTGEVCYIPEYALFDLISGDADESVFYDRQDFLSITNGDADMALRLFCFVDWQPPEAAWDEDEGFGEFNDELL